jgi:hypothetical protein
MLAGEAVAKLYDALGATPGAALEGLVAGDAHAPVGGIAACSVPSMAILRRAADAGCTLILCDSHPFYLYDPVWSAQISNPQTALASPIAAAKRAFITERKLAVVRLHGAWEARMPLSASLAFAAQLELGATEPRGDHLVCSIAATDARALGAALAGRGCGGLRMLGTPTTRASRIAVRAGMLTPATLAHILRDPAIDAIIAGDAVEWEATPYMEDAIAAGRRAALLLAGFAASMEPVGAAIGAWARGVFPELPVTWLAEPGLVRAA